MRITLIQPPTNYRETFLLSPPLGLLSVAAAAESEGAEVSLLDFNLKGLQDKRWQSAEYFYENAVPLILEQEPDMAGFTSMAIESHVCLEMARLLKTRNPDLLTLFGGPHFGAIPLAILENYPWCDYVVAGEGELPIQNLVRHFSGHDSCISMDNIAYRDGGIAPFKRQTHANIDLDCLPFPAYHLVDVEEYFQLNPKRVACFEHARGCFLKCSFCYSPSHWGHGESRKSEDRVLSELSQLEKLGFRDLFFVSDNFLNSREHAISLCQAIQGHHTEFTWYCYGTTAQADAEVVQNLADAGCNSIFFGIDAVSSEKKQEYRKSYFKTWRKLHKLLGDCLQAGIRPTCAFMMSPSDTEQQANDTLDIAARCAAMGCFVRLNALAKYPGSDIDDSDTKDSLETPLYDPSYAVVLFDSAEILIDNPYARTHPEIYPFHRSYGQPDSHPRFAAYCRLGMQLVNRHPLLSLDGYHGKAASPDRVLDITAERYATGLETISCRGLQNPDTRNQVASGFREYFHRGDVTDAMLDLDLYTSDLSRVKSIARKTVMVGEISIDCYVQESRFIRSSIDLERLEPSENENKLGYVITRRDQGFSSIAVSSNCSNLLNPESDANSARLSLDDYLRLNQHNIVFPAI